MEKFDSILCDALDFVLFPVETALMSGTPYFQQSSCIQYLFRRIFRVVIAGKEVDGCRYEIGASCHGDNPGRSLGPPGPRLPGHANSIRIQD